MVLLVTISFITGPISAGAGPFDWEIYMCDLERGCGGGSSPSTPAPSTCGATNVTTATLSLSGNVRGPTNESIEGACVYWDNGTHSASTKTDATGSYNITVLADRDTTLFVSKPLYSWNAAIIPQNQVLLASTTDINFNLTFLHLTEVTPQAVNNAPQKTVTISMLTTAPVSDSLPLAHMPDSVVELTHDAGYSGTLGWSRWTAAWTIPQSTPDGRYEFVSCVLLSSASGDCQAPSGPLLSPAELTGRPYFIVDSVEPGITVGNPAPGHTLAAPSVGISARVSDGLSGVDPETVKLFIDGQERYAYYSWGGELSATVGDLAPGIHTITVRAADLAGNQSEISWQFDLAELVASPATGKVIPKTQLVNPNKNFPPPTAVDIGDVEIELSSFDLYLSSSALTSGTGKVKRYLTLSGLKATFENELGQNMAVSVWPRSWVAFDIGVAVLEPQSGGLGVNIPSTKTTYSVGRVWAPAGFVVTDEATVTLTGNEEGDQADVNVYVPGNDVLPFEIACAESEDCTVTGVVSCNVNDSAVADCNGTYPRGQLERATSEPVSVFSVIEVANTVVQNSSTELKYPNPNPAEWVMDEFGNESRPNCGSGVDCRNVFDTSEHGNNEWLKMTAYWATGELFRAYEHSYYFKIVDGSSKYISAWQAADVHPGAVGCMAAKLVDFGHSVESIGSGVASWQLTASPLTPTVGSYNGAVGDFFATTGQDILSDRKKQDGNLLYRVGGTQLSTPGDYNVNLKPVLKPADLGGYIRGSYSSASNQAFSVDYPNLGALIEASERSSYNLWTPHPEPVVEDVDGDGTIETTDYRTRAAEIMTATEFVPASGGDGSSFEFRNSLYFKFKLVGGPCSS